MSARRGARLPAAFARLQLQHSARLHRPPWQGHLTPSAAGSWPRVASSPQLFFQRRHSSRPGERRAVAAGRAPSRKPLPSTPLGSTRRSSPEPIGNDFDGNSAGSGGQRPPSSGVGAILGGRTFIFYAAISFAAFVGFYTTPFFYHVLIKPDDPIPGAVDPLTLQCCPSHAGEQSGPGNVSRTITPPTGLPPDLTRTSAKDFDTHLDNSESLLGILSLRKRLAATARGDVLEVAVGTGRNVPYIDWADLGVPFLPPGEKAVRRRAKHGAGKGREAALEERAAAAAAPAGHGPAGRSASSDAARRQWEMTSYTGVDVSSEALELARRKTGEAIRDVLPAEVAARVLAEGRVRLIEADAAASGSLASASLPPPPGSPSAPRYYDTVLQTFGLCSVASPRDMLRHMFAAVRPDTGRIFLVEHGRSGRWDFINKVLDRLAGRHFVKYGCWFNRDIEALVRTAASEGLVVEDEGDIGEAASGSTKRMGRKFDVEVVKVERPKLLHFGTLLWIELRVTERREQ